MRIGPDHNFAVAILTHPYIFKIKISNELFKRSTKGSKLKYPLRGLLLKVGAREQMLDHARELSCLCLLVTFADARASPDSKLWKRFPTQLVFINQTKCFRSAYDAHISCLMKWSLWETIKIC